MINNLFEQLTLEQKATYYGALIGVPSAFSGPRPVDKMPPYFIIHKYGEIINAEVGDDVWDGSSPYTGQPISTVETVDVFSSDDEDKAGGTGASRLHLEGLCNNGNWVCEEILLNGTTPVTSKNKFSRLFRTHIQGAVGSDGTTAGTITTRHSTTTANVFAVQYNGQSAAAVFTVPRGFVAYFARGYASIRRGASGSYDRDVVLSLQARPNGGGWRHSGILAVATASRAQEFPTAGFFVPELCDIKISVDSINPATGTDITAGFDILCIKQELLP
jgi:hypothetical protein